MERSSYATQKRGSLVGQSVAVTRREEVERQIGVVAERGQRLEQVVAIDDDRDLVAGDEHLAEAFADAFRELGGHHLNVSEVRTFSCSFRMPCISISGFGGQPGT